MALRELKTRLIAWVQGFAEKPYAFATLFFHSLADSSFFPVTIDITFIPISLASPKKSYLFALWAILGSLLGAVLSYFIGMELMVTLGEQIVKMYNAEQTWLKMLETFRGEYAEWTLAVASLTPLPFSLATLASGVAEMDFTKFLAICIVGRTIRFLILAFLINKFGFAVQEFLDRYSKPLAITFFGAMVFFIIYLILIK